MANNTVTTTFFADEKAAAAAVARLEKKYDDIENKLKHVSKASRKESGAVQDSIGKWASSLVGVAGRYFAVGTAIMAVVGHQKELNELAEKQRKEEDRAERKLRVRAGLNAAEAAAATDRFHEIAVATGVEGGAKNVEQTASELAGAGFGKAAAGPILDEFVRAMPAISAASANAVSAADVAEHVKKSLERQEKALTPENVRSELADTFALLRASSVDMGDVQRIKERLQTAADDKQATGALRQLKLKPADVDQIGESFTEAMGRIGDALQNTPAVKRDLILNDLFGLKKLDSARELLDNVGVLEKNRGEFEDAKRIVSTGEAAGENRFKALEEQKLHERKTGFEEMLKANMQVREQQGVPWIARKVEEWTARGFHNVPILGQKLQEMREEEMKTAPKGTLMGDVRETMKATRGERDISEALKETNGLLGNIYEEFLRQRPRSRREGVGSS